MATSRVFFITDVHGSTRCFKKFLNSAKFYKASVLVLGGARAAGRRKFPVHV